jgi:hypothetical protein
LLVLADTKVAYILLPLARDDTVPRVGAGGVLGTWLLRARHPGRAPRHSPCGCQFCILLFGHPKSPLKFKAAAKEFLLEIFFFKSERDRVVPAAQMPHIILLPLAGEDSAPTVGLRDLAP